jgi:hypothetical protein
MHSTSSARSRRCSVATLPYRHSSSISMTSNLRARNARIAVAALQPVVVEIFDIARFAHVLEVFPTVRDAVAALSPSALAAWDASR